MFHLGIDVGSTTAKVVLLDAYRTIIFQRYLRHNARIQESLLEILNEARAAVGNVKLTLSLTGTAGMGVAERAKLPFVQEVVASSLVVQHLYPQVRTLIDIGGEDGKIILFDETEGGAHLRPTIRMNGNCAGGTGAFIDQMATLLGVDVSDLSALSQESRQTYPMASRCGVFAKTDVQTLMSRNISRADIIASVYRAVAFQTVSSLAHGADLNPLVMFTGGPLSFQAGLRAAFREVLGLTDADTFLPPHAELIPAIGAALNGNGVDMNLDDLAATLAASAGIKLNLTPTLPRLFSDQAEFHAWQTSKSEHSARRISLVDWEAEQATEKGLYLGIDCGSRTSKIALIDQMGRLAFEFYSGNDGDPLETVIRGLGELAMALDTAGIASAAVKASASTGYGEDLLRSAFQLDHGIVETLAHFRAAREWQPDVSFILDIGGQDMKAIFVADQVIQHMELNEACSSGTGSFIEGFAINLGYTVQEFARLACLAELPRDLGTRCTVFMNSKVKQALREGAAAGDIAAGLAYSVIKNCFHKVLKIHNPELVGRTVVAQGGTFKNPAVLRALELHLGFSVTRPDIAELMGAYGAALIARDRVLLAGTDQTLASKVSSFIGFDKLAEGRPLERKILTCKGCENFCSVTRMDFANGHHHYSGNKCEKVFGNGKTAAGTNETAAATTRLPFNMVELKRELLFNRDLTPKEVRLKARSKSSRESSPRLRIGIPRVLNMYDDFPFWCSLFVTAGFEVVLSDPSTPSQAEAGYSSVMSENVCFPAKIVHGHILNLIEKKVDRIFFPMVRHDRQEFSDSLNSFNCPVVTGYPEVIRSAINPQKAFGIPLDCPPLSFKEAGIFRVACVEYLCGLEVAVETARKAWTAADLAWKAYRTELSQRGKAARAQSLAEGRLGIMLLSRPYHADALLNQKLPEMITALGVDVYTDDLIGPEDHGNLGNVDVLTQWAFPNRFYDAAAWVSSEKNLELIHLNSFGCGPDAVTVDEVKAILNAAGKNPTLIRVDEVSSPGSLRLRVRSLIDSVRLRSEEHQGRVIQRVHTPVFQDIDRNRTILAPMFSPFYTDFIVEAFRAQGYQVEVLPMPDWNSVQAGLSYTNHDICYPATIVIGDLIKALKSGDWDQDKVAVAITQTGGQCRASSYVSLLRKALVNAGLERVPVVTLSSGSGVSAKLNQQPGFTVSTLRLGLNGFFGVLYADVLAKLFYAASVRENTVGAAWEKVEHWLRRGVETMRAKGAWTILGLLPAAIADFNTVLAHHNPLPKVGIVGEIYVKFNPFANNYVTDWLRDRQIEADVPPLCNFFLQKLVTADFNAKNHIEGRNRLLRAGLDIGESAINAYLRRINQMLTAFAVPLTPFHTMQHLAAGAEKVLSLINQYGESWLIAGDIAGFIESGTNNVVCLQPFGCIANHIIAKGVEKRLKETYPGLGLLFLDMDAGSSEVNLANRLEFLARSAWQSFESSTHTDSSPAEFARETS